MGLVHLKSYRIMVLGCFLIFHANAVNKNNEGGILRCFMSIRNQGKDHVQMHKPKRNRNMEHDLVMNMMGYISDKNELLRKTGLRYWEYAACTRTIHCTY